MEMGIRNREQQVELLRFHVSVDAAPRSSHGRAEPEKLAGTAASAVRFQGFPPIAMSGL